MLARFFREELEESEALQSEHADEIHEYLPPETCFRTVRETMEEHAYRTAITYTDNNIPSLYYWTSLKGISCNEVSTRNN